MANVRSSPHAPSRMFGHKPIAPYAANHDSAVAKWAETTVYGLYTRLFIVIKFPFEIFEI